MTPLALSSETAKSTKMKRTSILALSVLGLSACAPAGTLSVTQAPVYVPPVPSGSATNWTADRIKPGERGKVENAVRASLRDPGSAKFSTLHVLRSPGRHNLYCGLVNAKNGFGGYTGDVPFVVEFGDRPGVVFANNTNGKMVVAMLCKPGMR
jgi:hypothetical protein